MKTFLISLFSIIVLIFIIGFIAYLSAPKIVAHFLSKDFGVKVSIDDLSISKDHLNIIDFHVQNPKDSKTKTALLTKTIDINATLKDVRSEIMTIEAITLRDTLVGIEFYNKSGSKNNWSTIMNKPRNKKNDQRKYLIKTLTLDRLTVTLTKTDGTTQNFPTINKLQFHNISDDTGFPIDEIEKAIAHAVLQSIFQKFNLKNLLDSVTPSFIKKIIPIPFFGSSAIPEESQQVVNE